MGKVIINNRSSASDAEIANTVSLVMKEGRVSNNGKQYCYLVSVPINGKETHIVSDLNSKSDRFTAYDAPNPTQPQLKKMKTFITKLSRSGSNGERVIYQRVGGDWIYVSPQAAAARLNKAEKQLKALQKELDCYVNWVLETQKDKK